MIQIKFSHYYEKMPVGFGKSLLVGVLRVKLEDLGNRFKQFDTSYVEENKIHHYPLPDKGEYMILLLMTLDGNNGGWGTLWTTIRRWTPQKEAYYRKHIGEIVECVIT